MNSERIAQVDSLEEYGIKGEDIDSILSELPEYSFVKNTGQLNERNNRPYNNNEDLLDDDEKPEHLGREGESQLGVGYSDFEVLLAGMAGEGNFSVSEDQKLDLPEERKEEALGALFGASYAVFRHDVMENGFPADHDSFEQNIDTQEERESFLKEGAYEIEGEIMGSWDYDHQIINEIMDGEHALETYNKVADLII